MDAGWWREPSSPMDGTAVESSTASRLIVPPPTNEVSGASIPIGPPLGSIESNEAAAERVGLPSASDGAKVNIEPAPITSDV